MCGLRTARGLAMVIAVALAGACAGDSEQEWDSAAEGAAPAGWEWIGEGREQNFATADRFCRRTLAAADPRLGSEARSQLTGSDPGMRLSEADRRAYWTCMEGRGWRAQRA
ncbi:MAG: hypothetical protein ACFCUO_10275 [Rhodospirillales bacterium]